MRNPERPTTYTLAHHFRGKRAGMRKLFDEFVGTLRKELDFEYKIGKSYIGLRHKTVFVGLYIQTKKIVVEIVARKEIRHPRIRKTVAFDKDRWAYFVDVGNSSDIDEQLLEWIRQAHER